MSPETLPDKFTRLAQVLNDEHMERSEEIQCALQALVAGVTFFMVGEPGIAKSLLAHRIHAYIDGGEFFDHDLDKFSTPEDLFGPRSLKAMKADQWKRNIEGTLATADFAMLDEFFEASSALLKSLLRALNERELHQGTEIIPLRLTTLFAASNEVPGDPRLAALYDRLLIRRNLRRIQDPTNFMTMLKTTRPDHPTAILTWDDIAAAQVQCTHVKILDPVLEACTDIRSALSAADIHPTDRRFAESMKVVRAAAWLDGCTEAEPEHLRVLMNTCWNIPEQIPSVMSAIDAVLEPLISEADTLLRDVLDLQAQIRTDLDPPTRKKLANELHDKLRQSQRDLDALLSRSSGPRQAKRLDEVKGLISHVGFRILKDLFQVDASQKVD